MSSEKRKSDASTSTSPKKARLAHATAIETVESIVRGPDTFLVPTGAVALRKTLVELAVYARSLEEAISESKPEPKTTEELEIAAARSGIRKQMTWKTTCKTGSAKWAYDGVCPEPEMFAKFLGLDMPIKFKTKKIPKNEFEDLIGDLTVPIRYDTLCLTYDVNIQWKPQEGTFKFSGSYGK